MHSKSWLSSCLEDKRRANYIFPVRKGSKQVTTSFSSSVIVRKRKKKNSRWLTLMSFEENKFQCVPLLLWKVFQIWKELLINIYITLFAKIEMWQQFVIIIFHWLIVSKVYIIFFRIMYQKLQKCQRQLFIHNLVKEV